MRLGTSLGATSVKTTEPERELAWEGGGAAGLARLEPSSWGTKVTLTAWVEELEAQVARNGFFGRLFKKQQPPPPQAPGDIEERMNTLLDDLGSAHRKPFVNE